MPEDWTPPPLVLSSRVHLFAPVVTWRFDGEHLVRERKPGAKPDVLPVRDLHEVRLWRTMGIRSYGASLGAGLEARLRIAGRWWSMSAHHAEGRGKVVNRDRALLSVLRAAVRRRQAMGDGLVCRSGSGGQMIGAVLLLVVVLATVAAFVVGFAVRGLPPSPRWDLLIILCGTLAALLMLAYRLAHSGRRRTMSVAEFLDYEGDDSFHYNGG